MKKLMSILIILLCMPVFAFAYTKEDSNATQNNTMTEEEVLAKLNELPVTKEDGVEYMDVPSIDPDLFIEDGRCIFTKEEIINGDPDYYNSLSAEELENEVNASIEENEKYCAHQVYYSVLLFYFKEKNMDFHVMGYGADFLDKNNVKISYTDNISSISKSKNVKLRYVTEYNQSIRNEVKQIEKEIKKEYNIYGLSMLNSLYHYGDIDANIYNNDLVLYRFDDLKRTIEKHDDYKIVPRLHGAGGTPLLTGNTGNLGIFKDGIMYGMKETNFGMNHIIYVSKDEDGTLFEKAEKLVKEYFKNEVEVSVKTDYDETFENDPWVNEQINKYLGVKSGSYNGILTTINIDDKKSMLFIVEVEDKYLENTSIQSNHNKTGININTNSYHVPTDVTLDIESVLEEEYVKKFISSYKFNLNSAFDINLKKTGNGTFVNKIPEGVEVYIPIIPKKENGTFKIHHINEDSTLGETLEGQVVEIDGNTYVKFVTKHFSTYAIEENETNQNIGEEVPNTIDNIIIYYISFVISILGILIAYKQINKNN